VARGGGDGELGQRPARRLLVEAERVFAAVWIAATAISARKISPTAIE
jgi:hypothetical protein